MLSCTNHQKIDAEIRLILAIKKLSLFCQIHSTEKQKNATIIVEKIIEKNQESEMII